MIELTLGLTVSTVTESAEDAPLTLPAVSSASAVKVWAPRLKADEMIDHLPEPSARGAPKKVVPSLSNSVTVESASATPVIVGVVMLVTLSLAHEPVSLRVSSAGAPGR